MKIGTSGQGGIADGMALLFFGIARTGRANVRGARLMAVFSHFWPSFAFYSDEA